MEVETKPAGDTDSTYCILNYFLYYATRSMVPFHLGFNRHILNMMLQTSLVSEQPVVHQVTAGVW